MIHKDTSNEPILVVVSNGRTKVFSSDTTQNVYIIDQRSMCDGNEYPTLTKAIIEKEDVSILANAYNKK